MKKGHVVSNGKRAGLLGGISSGLFLLGISVAWACTAQPVIGAQPVMGRPGSSGAGSGLMPSSGPAGFAPVKVEGRAFTEGPVQIRWDSVDGPHLATATGPNFSVDIRIPDDASSGVYSVVAFQRDASGKVSSIARAPFEVTSASPEPQSAPGSASGGASGATEGGVSGGRTSASLDSGEGSRDSEIAAGTGSGSPGTAGTAGARQGSSPRGVAAPPSTAQNGSGPAAPAGVEAPATGLSAEPAGQPAPSARTALSDLWSGFERGRFGPTLPITPPDDSMPNTLVAGTAVLALALVSLLAGLAFAESRRRRVASAP